VTTSLLLALTLFAFVSTVTPGPNNMMLLASGANFGFRRTIPHMLGISIGFSIMVILVGVGMVQIFDAWPTSYTLLKYVSIAYLLYLAYKIATTKQAATNNSSTSRPFTFVQASLFQWVNPKAWTMALTSLSVYSPNQDIISTLIVAAVFALVNLPSVSIWALVGKQMQRWLGSTKRLRTFNISMALILVVSLIPAL